MKRKEKKWHPSLKKFGELLIKEIAIREAEFSKTAEEAKIRTLELIEIASKPKQ